MAEILPDDINQVNDDGDVVVRDDLADSYGFTGNTIRETEEDIEESKKPIRSRVARAASKIIFTPNPADTAQAPDGNVETGDGIDEEELLEGTSAAGKKRSVRMAEALRTHGFAPENHLALTRYSLREATPSISGSAKVFNTIYLHQKKLLESKDEDEPVDGEMPKRTMFAVAREYRGFIERARTAQSALTSLTQYLEREDPTTPLAETRSFDKKSWIHEGILYQAVVTLQLMENEDALARGKTQELPKLEEYFSSDHDVTDALDENIVHSFTVGEVLKRAEEGIERHKKARQYWIEQLQEVVKFGHRGNYAAIAAKKELERLNIAVLADATMQ
jgi:hypothetical protein